MRILGIKPSKPLNKKKGYGETTLKAANST